MSANVIQTLEIILLEVRSYKERAERSEEAYFHLSTLVAEHQILAGPLVKGAHLQRTREIRHPVNEGKIAVSPNGDVLGSGQLLCAATLEQVLRYDKGRAY